MLLLLILLAGIASGLRSLTPTAVVAWAAHLGALDLAGTPLSFLSSTVAVASFTPLAIGELVFDKLPIAPNRTEIPGLAARLLFGALAGGAVAVSGGFTLALGGVIGGLGGLAGAFAGYEARTRLTRKLPGRSLAVALAEDAFAITASVVATALA
jgi:uncharacterized membrane protein